MEVFPVYKNIKIQSHKGIYHVEFSSLCIENLNQHPDNNAIYIIDDQICNLYQNHLNKLLACQRILRIDAKEENKSIEKIPEYIKKLLDMGIRKNETLVAIGGGIIQDITCFISTILLRGIKWVFYPTTLLAQADSCIGSKSSINCLGIKNILGTFTPPEKIIIDAEFLNTLKKQDILSGIGEIIKVHAIHSHESFLELEGKYDLILSDMSMMKQFIYRSLIMKQKFIEIDEFDKDIRNVMNYGHSFGHAIEAATNYKIPHGIAVSIGMDMANYIAAELGISTWHFFNAMHNVLEKNYTLFSDIEINLDLMLTALNKDKKNSNTQLKLILPDKNGKIFIGLYNNDKNFRIALTNYFDKYRTTLKERV